MDNTSNKAVSPYVIWTIIFFVSMALAQEMTFINIPKHTPDSPPWYFILTDLRESLAAIIGFVLSLILIFLYYRKTDSTSYTLIFFTLIWYGHDIGNGISILLNTSNIFNTELATSNWITLEQYLKSPWNSYIFYLLLFFLSLLFIYLNDRMKKESEPETKLNA